MILTYIPGSRLPCFTGVTNPTSVNSKPKTKSPTKSISVSSGVRDRLQLGLTDSQVPKFINNLLQSSMNNNFTNLYDTFQVSNINLNLVLFQ